jgi:hypothetical protein
MIGQSPQSSKSLSDIKFEFSHDSTLLAQEVLNLRSKLDLSTQREDRLNLENEELAEKAKTAEMLRAEFSATVAQQEREIENYAQRQVEMKELLAALQSKYTLSVERLAHSEHLRATEATAHLAYVTAMQKERYEVHARLKKLEVRGKYITSLVEENNALAAKANQRIVWTRVKAFFAEKVQRIILRQEDEDALRQQDAQRQRDESVLA